MMSPETAQQYRRRWHALAELERTEQQAASVSQRWQQFAAILSFGRYLPLAVAEMEPDEADVWQRLRKRYEHARRA